MSEQNPGLPIVPSGTPLPPAIATGTYGAPLAPDADDGAAASGAFLRYLAAVRRHRWAVLAIVVVGTGIGFGLSRMVRPEYAAEATIWFESQVPGPIQSPELLNASAWLDLLRSFQVLDHVVREQRLYLKHDPEDRRILASFEIKDRFRPGRYTLEVSPDGQRFVLRSAQGGVVQRGMVGDSVGPSLGFRWVPPRRLLVPGRVVRFEVGAPREAARDLATRLRTRLGDRNARFLRIALTGEDPERVTAVVNAVADRYESLAAELKRAKQDEIARILDEQLRYAEENLRSAEIALEDFRIQTITLPSQTATPLAPGLQMTQSPVFGNFFGLKIQQDQLRRDRQAIEAAISNPDVSLDALLAIASVQQAPELARALQDLTNKRVTLRGLRQQYTDEHGAVVRALREVEELEQQVIPQLARRVTQDLAARERMVEEMIDAASSELREIPPRAIDEARLERRVAIAERLYNDLRARYEQARLSALTSTPDLRILDRATVPTRPLGNDRNRMILIGFLGSLALALAGAILLDRLDPRLRYPDQVTRDLGLPIVGMLPLLPVRKKTGASTIESAQVVEALRGIRMSLLHAHSGPGAVCLTVSSPGSGDGKSFLVSNLALAFTDLGHRTLVIDGDTRRGDLHHLLGTSRKPGLIDFLAGQAAQEEIIQTTRFGSLDFIGSGTRRREAPELIASPRMFDLIARLRAEYDVVLVDSPPLSAGIDPLVLGTATGNMLLIMRAGRTDRALAGAKLAALDGLPIRLLGTVLNAMEPGGVYRYYSYAPDGGPEGEEVGGVEGRPPVVTRAG